MSSSRWLPLESNPAVMNKFLANLGVNASWQVHDVYGLDDDLLAIVPQPVAALLLLYPLTDKAVEEQAKEEERLEADNVTAPDSVFFMKQYVGNACGTVALIHAIANNTDKIEINDGALKSFLDKSKDLNYADRGHALETDTGIAEAHEMFASEGQTEVPNRDESIFNHFIVFVNSGGVLYELDGRKSRPIEHGTTSDETILTDAAAVCRKFMDRDPSENRFALCALTAAQ